MDHLGEDASCRPQIDSESVGLLTEENFGASVPECDDFVSVGLDRETEGTRETEVSKFDHSAGRVDKQVLRLQVTVEDSVLMQVDQSEQDLVQEALCLLFWQWVVSMLLHVLFEIVLKVLEDQVELVLRVDDLLKSKGANREQVVRIMCGQLLLTQQHSGA